MNEVKKCSLSGVAFTMDVDAFETLNDYLESLRKTYGDTADGAEIVADIEARIAELILSAQDSGRVVEKPLVLNIIRQMGTAEDIADGTSDGSVAGSPRIPRRLYRDTENAKLGGVCAGIGKYFDVDPVWIRLGLFLPLIFSGFGWIPFLHWSGPMMGNLFGIFVICYLIMWFVVPPARTARQKLEMNGERITVQSIGETTVAAAAVDPDAKARPIVAEAVSVFGKVVLILMKIFAGLLVFGLIMLACALIIGLFTLLVAGSEQLFPFFLHDINLWVPVLGIFVVLIPVMLLIYVLMCLVASRKPGGKTVLAIFLLWILSIAACAGVALRSDAFHRLRERNHTLEEVLREEFSLNGEPTTLEELLDEYRDETTVRENRRLVRISVPSRSIDIAFDKKRGELMVNADGKRVTLRAGEDGASMQVTASDGSGPTLPTAPAAE